MTRRNPDDCKHEFISRCLFCGHGEPPLEVTELEKIVARLNQLIIEQNHQITRNLFGHDATGATAGLPLPRSMK